SDGTGLPISGAEYLEKLVHLPMRVPKPGRYEIRTFIEAEYRELFSALTRPDANVGAQLLELFCMCTPPVPRKIIRALEMFTTLHEHALTSGYQHYRPLLLARLVLLQLFAP